MYINNIHILGQTYYIYIYIHHILVYYHSKHSYDIPIWHTHTTPHVHTDAFIWVAKLYITWPIGTYINMSRSYVYLTFCGKNEVNISPAICLVPNNKQWSWNNTTRCGISSPFELLIAVQIRRERCVMESIQSTFLIFWQFTLYRYSCAYKHSTGVAIAQVNDFKLGYRRSTYNVLHTIPCCHHLLIPSLSHKHIFAYWIHEHRLIWVPIFYGIWCVQHTRITARNTLINERIVVT